MFRSNLSNSSESEDQNFDGHYKKVNYQGNFSDSERQDSEMDDVSEQSRKIKCLQVNGNSSKSPENPEKFKSIKKNCQSAKMSRHRKKVYLDLLERKAQQLTNQIYNRKVNIKRMSQKILQKYRTTNREKYNYMVEKIALSKRIKALSTQIQLMKRTDTSKIENQGRTQHIELLKNISPQTLAAEAAEKALDLSFEEITKKKTKRKKGNSINHEGGQRNDQAINLLQQTTEKENALELGIMAYMYQFGVRGCLRSDVIERSKYQWFEILQKSHMHSPEQLSNNAKNMKNCFDRLEDKVKKLDYFLRELKNRVKDKYVVQFLLDRQFFIHETSDSIYKKQKTAIESE